MAQDDAPMSTFWFQVLVTLVAAGVRNQPRIEHRISLFTAVAFISMEKFTVSLIVSSLSDPLVSLLSR